MREYNLTEDELESMNLWVTVEEIKEKILWETENENPDIQAMMISYEVKQIIRELLGLSIEFTRRILVHK